MERKSLLKKFLEASPAYLITIGLLFPLAVFLFQSHGFQIPKGVSWISTIGFTLFQSVVATIFVLIMSSLGALGLLYFYPKKYYILLKTFVILPALIPPLVLVISLVHFFDFFMPFPFGLTMLILTQILTYTGLCSIALTSTLIRSISHVSEWALVHGIRPFYFFITCLKTFLKKDLITLGVLVFSGAFTSLSLPLLVSGNSHFSLEFFIYEKLKQPNMWGQASFLICLQMIFIFLICLKAFSFSSSSLKSIPKKIHLLKKPNFIFFSIWPSCLILCGLLFASPFKIMELFEFKSLFISASLTSFLISVGVGFSVFLGMTALFFSYKSKKIRKVIVGYINPSVTLLGFSFLIFFPDGWVYLKWILGLSLLFFPIIYRFRGEVILEKLEGQAMVAELFGASRFMIFKCILWPQARSFFFLCSGITAFWACGDFAYSLIVSEGKWNLALVVYDLFSSYRIDLALAGSLVLILVSILVFLFWLGVDFVFNKKSFL